MNPADWIIRFENAQFFKWFPPGGDIQEQLAERLSGLDESRARRRVDDGRPYRYDTEVKVGARTVSINVEIRTEEIDGDSFLLVECTDTSKQKEAEYMLDSYSRMAEKNARELEKEKDRVEKLLLNIMPRSVYEEMRDYGTTTPQRVDAASILMLDFVDFTEMAIARDPGALVAELNDIFSAFDRIVDLFGCERIKTIGDCYVAVSGLPEANVDHASNIAKVALRMRHYLEKRNASHPTQWICRIGIATGPVIGSVVGIQKYVYDIFGPAVNLAARMESVCKPMEITMTAETYDRIGDEFAVSELGDFKIKGFGDIPLYRLEGEHHGPTGLGRTV